MDRSNNGTYSRTQDTPRGKAFEPGHASFGSQDLRLQNKNSSAGIRNASQMSGLGVQGSEGNKARKGSLRNAVRKIFGRRSKEIEQQPQQHRSPPRHGYHKSEPQALATQQEEPDPYMSSPEQQIPHRTLSEPLHIIAQPSFAASHQRTRSPYAVEFPRSARLKPLNLGNPFSAPGSQLRRRKTLPSVLFPEGDAANLPASIASADAPPVPSLGITSNFSTPDIPFAASRARSEKRWSKSAEDLKGALLDKQSPPRKRSDEIRYWRESFQGSVLRASGFTRKEPRDFGAENEDIKTPLRRETDPFTETGAPRSGGALRSSPPLHYGPTFSDTDFRSASGYGTELSRDLEDRVAKLEAGLQYFQRSLRHLATEGGSRTAGIGGARQQQASTDARTPSMLADTLADPLGASSYDYNYSDTRRPSTSPQPPRTPDRLLTRPPLPISLNMPIAGRDHSTFGTPPAQPIPSTAASGHIPDNGNGRNASQNYTFRSLYEMLSDERSARRKLETEMRGLRQEITDLQYQVSVQSNVASQRSSYNIRALDPMVGSSRLRELLRETESSGPSSSTPEELKPDYRNSGATGFSSIGQRQRERVVSRFSGSESETGGVGEERSTESLTTPYESYQTPHEERSRFPFVRRDRDEHEGEMF